MELQVEQLCFNMWFRERPNRNGLQPTSDGLQPNRNGFRRSSSGLQPGSNGLQLAMASNLEHFPNGLSRHCTACVNDGTVARQLF